MANEDWIETEIEKLNKRAADFPPSVATRINTALREGLSKDQLTAAQAETLANSLLAAIRQQEVIIAD